jgi:UDP-N-acetylglucosamine 1-carboxyvinyltransferase
MNNHYLHIQHSQPFSGTVALSGAKNAVLVIMASLLLTRGVSVLHNVPAIADVYGMIDLLSELGVHVSFDPLQHILTADTSRITSSNVSVAMMSTMRASVLVMGSLLARQGVVSVGLPGGCGIGERPIDYHLNNFKKMGVVITQVDDEIHATVSTLHSSKIVLAYPSVGATENIVMLATSAIGQTRIINAALEPEVFDLIKILKKMGADITVDAPATIIVNGGKPLFSVEHTVMSDRLEAGSLLLAAAATGGSLTITQAKVDDLEVFLLKLEEMGHTVIATENNITLHATKTPRAVSFKTGPFPSFPTDLQAPMMALLCCARGTSVIEETVFENRFMHVNALRSMGAQIEVVGNKALVTGVSALHGANVDATDIRASMALVIAGLMAQGTTQIGALHHWYRGYDGMEKKLASLGAIIDKKA